MKRAETRVLKPVRTLLPRLDLSRWPDMLLCRHVSTCSPGCRLHCDPLPNGDPMWLGPATLENGLYVPSRHRRYGHDDMDYWKAWRANHRNSYHLPHRSASPVRRGRPTFEEERVWRTWRWRSVIEAVPIPRSQRERGGSRVTYRMSGEELPLARSWELPIGGSDIRPGVPFVTKDAEAAFLIFMRFTTERRRRQRNMRTRRGTRESPPIPGYTCPVCGRLTVNPRKAPGYPERLCRARCPMPPTAGAASS